MFDSASLRALLAATLHRAIDEFRAGDRGVAQWLLRNDSPDDPFSSLSADEWISAEKCRMVLYQNVAENVYGDLEASCLFFMMIFIFAMERMHLAWRNGYEMIFQPLVIIMGILALIHVMRKGTFCQRPLMGETIRGATAGTGYAPSIGQEDAGMINAGIAEYTSILTGIGGTPLTSFEPTTDVILIGGVIIFLFWLVVFKL